jgi:hypothetical protein
LKPWRDGWRHLRFMLLFSPRWLFLVPGIVLFLLGAVASLALLVQNIQIGAVTLNVGTLAVSCMMTTVGFQLVAFAFFFKVFAIAEGLLPDDPKLTGVLKFFTLEKGLIFSLLIFLAGLVLLVRSVWVWGQAHFGELQMEENLRHVIPAAALVLLGIQGIFSSFFMSALGLKTKTRKPPAGA